MGRGGEAEDFSAAQTDTEGGGEGGNSQHQKRLATSRWKKKGRGGSSPNFF